MDRPLKIALVSPYDHAFPGGVAVHINKLAGQFEERGHYVKVIAPCSDPERVDQDNFIPMGRPVPVPSGGSVARISFSVWLRPRLKSLLRRERFHVVHLHEPFAGFVTLNVLGLSDSINIGTFHTYRGHRFYRLGGTRIFSRYFRRLHGRIAVSYPAYNFINRAFPAHYEIIPNGIQVEDFEGAEPFPHLMDGRINLLFVGRLEKRKGLRYLLCAYSRLKWDWPDLRLLVVGPGTPDHDSYRVIGERGLTDVVFTGPVSEEDKARYFKSAHIFCSPAVGRESFGIVLLEAMAAGVPVVASDIEGYASVVTHRREALLVPPKDDAALAEAILSLLRDPALGRRLAQEGRRTVQEYRWDRIADRVMDYYRTFLDARAVVSR